MFKSFFGSILETISGLNPIKSFIKYALDKTLNQFLTHELRLQDFTNGVLNLTSISLNLSKINLTHLVSSPYILHEGSIGRLRICLPPLTQISTKSIEISVSEAVISLRPNKNFYQNFKEALNQKKEDSFFYVEEREMEGQINQNGPIDFFKQLLKQIVLNIKVKIENTIVKLYMNEPQGKTYQYYLMLRVPSISVDKNEDFKAKSIDIEELKFDLTVPQASLHLMRDGIDYPEFSNQSYKKGDFPFVYPTINSPSTLILMGFSQQPCLHSSAKSDKIAAKIVLVLKTNFKEKIKETSVKVSLQNVQAMIDSLQAKILSRFVVQILQFKKIMQHVLGDIGVVEEANAHSRLEKSRIGRRDIQKSMCNDIFSSIVFSMADSGVKQSGIRNNGKGEPSIFKSFISQNRESVHSFNAQCLKEISKDNLKAMQLHEQFQSYNFKSNLLIKLEVKLLRIHAPKILTRESYLRRWHCQAQWGKINQSIGCSHFSFMLKKLQFSLTENGKLSQLSIDQIKLYNVKLTNCNLDQEKSPSKFYDIQQSKEFQQGSSEKINKPLLQQFNIGSSQHYCAEEVLRISHKPSQHYFSDKTKIYSFLPPNERCQGPGEEDFTLYKPGFSLTFDKPSSYLKVKIQQINIAANLQIVKELLDYSYPVFTYGKLATVLALQKQEIVSNLIKQEENQKRSILESNYNFQDYQANSSVEQAPQRRKLVILLAINEVSFCLLERIGSEFSQLAKRETEKTSDGDNQFKGCFCGIDKHAVYMECYSIQINQKQSDLKVCFKVLQAGIVEFKRSEFFKIHSLITLGSNSETDETVRFYIMSQANQQTIQAYAPSIKVRLEQHQAFILIELAANEIRILQELVAYRGYLQNRMNLITGELNCSKKRPRHGGNVQKYLSLYVHKVKLEAIGICLNIQELLITKMEDEIIIKCGKLVAAVAANSRLLLGQMKNQVLCLSQFEAQNKYVGIPNQNIFLEINNPIKEKLVFHSTTRKSFYEKKANEICSINVTIINRQIKEKNSKNSMDSKTKFKFAKNKSSAMTIEEEKQQKAIDILITRPIYIYTHLFPLLHAMHPSFLSLVKHLKVFNQETINKSDLLIFKRKSSMSSETDNQEIDMCLHAGRMNIELRPYFQFTGADRVFSNSRSIFTLFWDNMRSRFNKESNSLSLKVLGGAEYWFLIHKDRNPELNSILLDEEEYKNLGFKNILQLRDISAEITHNLYDKLTIVSINVFEVQSVLSQYTLFSLKLHLQQFNKHCLHSNYGKPIFEDHQEYENLQIDLGCNEEIIIQNEPEIADLTNGFQYYTEKLKKKQSRQKKFKSWEFQQATLSQAIPHPKIKLTDLTIKSIDIKLHSGDDFDFIQVNDALFESKERRRQRYKDNAKLLEYMGVSMEKLTLSAFFQGEMDKDSNQKEDIQKNTSQKGIFCMLLSVGYIDLRLSMTKEQGGFLGALTGKKYQEQVLFELLKIETDYYVMVHKTESALALKASRATIYCGFTSELLKFSQKLKAKEEQIKWNGWRRLYKQEEDLTKKDQAILLLMPDQQCCLTLNYGGIELLSSQTIKTKQLLIHQETNNRQKMQKDILKWVKKLMANNVGRFISGSAVQLFSGLIDQIIRLVRVLLENVFYLCGNDP